MLARTDAPTVDWYGRLSGLLDNEGVSGKLVSLVMTVVTVFSLFGSDIQKGFLDKHVDEGFELAFFVSLVLFTVELLLSCLAKPGYKWSFFFWLDVMATVSLLLDIPWLWAPIVAWALPTASGGSDGGSAAVARAGRAGRLGARAGRVVRVFKILRVLKPSNLKAALCNTDDAQSEVSEEPEEAAHSTLGNLLSESNTRKVILSVLIMLTVQPMLADMGSDSAPTVALDYMFYGGSSRVANCAGDAQFPCEHIAGPGYVPADGWTTPVGWQTLAIDVAEAQSEGGALAAKPAKDLLALVSADFDEFGRLGRLEHFATGTRSWRDSHACAVLALGGPDEGCPYRDSELLLARRVPAECADDPLCEQLTTYAVFRNEESQRTEAVHQIYVTFFVVVLLATGSWLFSAVTHALVVLPIEHMVLIVKDLARDPLRRAEPETTATQMETRMLENAILKIGALLQVGFGEAGAVVIGENMARSDGALQFSVPGRKVQAVYGFAEICDFRDITEALQEEVMVFVNKIASIVHCCASEWDGSCNKNMGSSFLIVWLQPKSVIMNKPQGTDLTSKIKAAASVAERALIAFIKVLAAVRKAPDLAIYAKHPHIVPKFGPDFAVSVTMGLHSGWAIEGTIGSQFKIDASYLSLHVNMAARLQSASKLYGVDLLVSEAMHKQVSRGAQQKLRHLDTVLLKGTATPSRLYALDSGPLEPGDALTEPNGPFAPILAPLQDILDHGTSSLYALDTDVVEMARPFTAAFNQAWNTARTLYLQGDWADALPYLATCQTLLPHYKPTIFLLDFINSHDGKCPEDWKGFRPLYVK